MTEDDVRKIVREELHIRFLQYQVPRWTEMAFDPAIKPKTDLERAAIVAERASHEIGHCVPPNTYLDGFNNAKNIISRDIRALKPGPDWRQIASDLCARLAYLHGYGHDPDCRPCAAIKAYHEAVRHG